MRRDIFRLLMATRAVTHVSGGRPAESMKVLLMLLAHAGSGVCLLTAIDGSVVHAQTSAMGFCQTDHSDSPFTPLGKEFGSTERQTIRCTPTDQGSGEEIKGNTGIQSRFRPRDDIPASQVRQEGNNIDLVIDPGVIFRSNLATVGLGSGVSIVNSGILETTGGTFAYGISLGRNGRLQAGGNSIVNTALGIIRTSGTGSTAIFVDASLASSGGNQIINEGVIQATGRDSHGIRLITGANNAANLIDNSGSITVEAPGMAGILLESLRGSTDRIVNSGSIESSGAEGRGIAVKNDGSVASNQVAIENEANGVVSASGVGGVGVEVVGSGNVTNAGRIEGSLDGVRLLARATSGVNTISNSGVIVSLESGGAGVRLESEGSNDRIVNSGSIESSGAEGRGIAVKNDGSVASNQVAIENEANGVVSASGAGGVGVEVVGSGNVTNAGRIEGSLDGVRLLARATSGVNTISNSGVIVSLESGGAGVRLESEGSNDRIVNSGSIESSGAEGRGIAVRNDGSVASNQVAIENEANGVVSASGAGGVGVEVVGSGNVTNAGRIEGSLDGVRLLARATSGVNTISNSGVIVSLESGGAGVRLESEGSNDRIVNSGSIESSGAEGRGIAVKNDGSVASNQVAIENEANGVVSASGVGGVGVEVVGSGNVTNAGRIEGSLDGVRLLARATSGVNTISNSGVIVSLESGGAGVRLESEGSNDRIVNSGSIESSGAEGRGIAVKNDGNVASNQVAIENEANGVVSASGVGGVGVEVVGSGNVTNAGRIEGSLDGVRLLARATSGVNTISNSGVIVSLESGGAGVRLESEGSNDRIVNSGSIESSGAEGRGIAVRNDGSVASNQVAIENEANGVVSASGAGGVGVEVVGSGNVTNAGRIEGSLDGVRLLARATSGVNTISNSGVIVSLESGGAGVRLESEGSNDRIVNSGSIESSGAEGRGIAVRNDGSVASNQVAIENEANGVVSASGAGGVGVEVVGSGNVTNAGRIEGSLDGVRLLARATSGVNTISNSGVIVSLESGGAGVRLESEGSNDRIVNSGSIESSGAEGRGIAVRNDGSVASNQVAIENEANGVVSASGVGGVGVEVLGSALVLNRQGGRIQANSDGLRLNNADRLRSMELINAGQIFSSSSYGVNVLGSAIVENEAGGLIQGDAYGVNIDDLGTGSASVLINQPGGRIIGLRNASTIRLTREEDFAGRFVDLRIDGPYLGENGVLLMNTEIAGDDAPSDRLTVSGSTIRGFTTLRISNIDGLGASTIKNGILLVNAIEGATSQAGSFGLSGPIEVGPYAYYLFKGGVTAGSEESWFLRNSLPTLPETISDAGNRPGGNGGGAASGTTTERPSGGGGSGSGNRPGGNGGGAAPGRRWKWRWCGPSGGGGSR
jgi:hypothetical protein